MSKHKLKSPHRPLPHSKMGEGGLQRRQRREPQPATKRPTRALEKEGEEPVGQEEPATNRHPGPTQSKLGKKAPARFSLSFSS